MKRLAAMIGAAALAFALVSCDNTKDIDVPDSLGISWTDWRFAECASRLNDWVEWDGSTTDANRIAVGIYCTELVLNHPHLDTGPWIDEWQFDPERHHPRRLK